jgi:hypothetical protein
MSENFKNVQQLTGKGNYLGWSRVTLAILEAKGHYLDNEFVKGSEQAIIVYLLTSVTLEIAGKMPTNSPAECWAWLKQGYGNTNASEIKSKLKRAQMIGIDINGFLDSIDSQLAALNAAGGSLSEEDLFEIILDGVHDVFYLELIRSVRRQEGEKSVLKLRQSLLDFYWSTPASVRDSFITKKVNHVEGATRRRKFQCAFCMKHNRFSIQQSHSTDRCFYGDQPGWNRLIVEANHVAKDSNKQDSCYLPAKAYFDTGCSGGSFFNSNVPNMVHARGQLFSAESGSKAIPIIGSGKVRFGNLEIPVHVAPGLRRNLVSGVAVMESGHSIGLKNGKMVVASDIVVPKTATIVATAHLETSTGLLRMDDVIDRNSLTEFRAETAREALNVSNVSIERLHDRLGHISNDAVRRTEKHVEGIQVNGQTQDMTTLCESCVLGKSRRRNIPRTGSTPRDILEVIEADTQGPFPITGIDGTRLNVKFIDSHSGYLNMAMVADHTAGAVKVAFERFQTRLERRTGKKIKYLRTDMGTEFMGPLREYLISNGIVNQTSVAYTHHYPGKAERVHQSVLQSARAMLIGSKLPAEYYTEALKTAAYLHNRIVHNGAAMTPYEMIYGRKPDVSNLRVFGCICYAFVSPERRSKLEPSAVKCRLIGYGDDDDIVEVQGYKLLRESDRTILYCSSVRFDEEAEIEPLESNGTVNDDVADVWNYNDNDLIYSREDTAHHIAPRPAFIAEPVEGENLMDGLRTEPQELEEAQAPRPNLLEQTNEQHSLEPGIAFYPEPLSSDDSASVPPQWTDEEGDRFLAEMDERYGSNGTSTQLWESHNVRGLSPEDIYAVNTAISEDVPNSYKDAISSPDSAKWVEAMDKEMESINKAKTWILAPIPSGRRTVKCRWVYKKKLNSEGEVIKYKARLVAKGYTQQHGVDFNETYAPVAKFKTIRVLAAIAAARNLECYQDDVPTAFLKGDLKEEVWMEQPEGYVKHPSHKCHLQKTLYGLKQSPREWNTVLHQYLIGCGFTSGKADTCLYFKSTSDGPLIVAIYVDDIISIGRGNSLQEFRKSLHLKFGMDNGSTLTWYLGVRFARLSDGSLTLDQSQYLRQKLSEFDHIIGPGGHSTPLPVNYQIVLDNAKEDMVDPTFPYRQMLGSLMYAMVGTRPDIAVAVGVLSRFMTAPRRSHCGLLIHVYLYIRSNLNKGLHYQSGTDITLCGYVDASYGNNRNFKSTTGCCYLLGGSLVSWLSKCQPVTAISAAEAEVIAATEAAKEVAWLRKLLLDIGISQGPVILFEDNQACIHLATNPQQYHKRTKHIQIQFHFIQEQVDLGLIKLQYVSTKEQLADIFTKVIPGHLLRPITAKLGLTEIV